MDSTAMTPCVNEHKAAEILGASVFTLRGWRAARRGPQFYKVGRSVKYRIADLEAYLQTVRVKTSEA